ncbi:XtrA/YqaO family protein [Bacillus sp. CLL-7-23]|uniref:XtrA/YqaO family protein n=1 Tax=Bacillus changyiensis TaxID=3004103 RepID=A0ABT4X8A1_9BACI|nr:XtrA/YqaO family protein [Bacillus changyiensis]MDA7028504.1 XtrA/YqaO family protein [Bacillus changyiensis]
MNQPKEISINDDLTFSGKIEPNKLMVLIVDGSTGTVKTTDVPFHGLLTIETVNGKFKRLDHKIGFKL